MQDDYFIMAAECHLNPDLKHLSYYPKVKTFWESSQNLVKIWRGPGCGPQPADWNVEALIKDMNESGIDVACALRECFMHTTDQATPWGTNGWILEQIEKFPDRLVLEANVGPILRRGVEPAIWEMEYLVKERDAKLVKVYQCEDTGPLNDPAMWPFYEKASELGVPLTVHTGIAYCVPDVSKNVQPLQIEDILNDFPELKMIAYHMGWPRCEDLFCLAQKFKNLYISLSLLLGWFTWAPYRGYHLIGEAMQWCGGADKLIFGLDWPCVETKACVDYIKNFNMPDELIEKWGYRNMTEQDKRMILGETLAKLTGVEIRKRV